MPEMRRGRVGSPSHYRHTSGFQRAFFAWLDEARRQLSVGINTGACTAKGIEFSFDVSNPVLQVWISGDAEYGVVTVEANWAGECWDFLLNLEVRVSATSDGFVCSLCEPDTRRVFPSLEALWRDHLFDPFQEWVNTKLAPARAVALFQSDSTRGATWARLIPKGEAAKTAAFLIAL